jgi:hypothetical protein
MNARNVWEFLSVVFALGAFGLYVASAAWLAWWTLEPLNRVAGQLRATPRFLLADFLALMVLLQIGLAVSGQALDAGDVGQASAVVYWIILGVNGVLLVVLWAASVSVVSRAGITRPLRRIAVTVLLIPATLGVIVTLPAVVGAVAVGVWLLVTLPEETNFSLGAVLLTALAALVLGGVAVGLRRMSYWALAGSPGEQVLAGLNSQIGKPVPPVPPPAADG